jgi:hypothetical protein
MFLRGMRGGRSFHGCSDSFRTGVPSALRFSTDPLCRLGCPPTRADTTAAPAIDPVHARLVSIIRCLCHMHRTHALAFPHLRLRLEEVSRILPPAADVVEMIQAADWVSSLTQHPASQLPWFEGCFECTARAVLQLLAVDERCCAAITGASVYGKQV